MIKFSNISSYNIIEIKNFFPVITIEQLSIIKDITNKTQKSYKRKPQQQLTILIKDIETVIEKKKISREKPIIKTEPKVSTGRKGNLIIEHFAKNIDVMSLHPGLNQIKGDDRNVEDTIFFAFNHTSTRFEHAFPLNDFLKAKEKYPGKTFVIIELGVGDEKSAKNNPPELSWFKIEKYGLKIRVIKFWYDTDFKFTALENKESRKTLNDDYFEGKTFEPIVRKTPETGEVRKMRTKSNWIIHKLQKNMDYSSLAIDLKLIKEGDEIDDLIFFSFNHVSTRFEHAFPLNDFLKEKEKYPGKKFVILEFGIGDEKSAINNPPELSWFENEKNNLKLMVIKFWYNTELKFVAPQNKESRKKVEEIIREERDETIKK